MIDYLLNSPCLLGTLLIILVVAGLIIVGLSALTSSSDNPGNDKSVTYHQTGVNGLSGKGNKFTRYNRNNKEG